MMWIRAGRPVQTSGGVDPRTVGDSRQAPRGRFQRGCCWDPGGLVEVSTSAGGAVESKLRFVRGLVGTASGRPTYAGTGRLTVPNSERSRPGTAEIRAELQC